MIMSLIYINEYARIERHFERSIMKPIIVVWNMCFVEYSRYLKTLRRGKWYDYHRKYFLLENDALPVNNC